MSFYVDPTRRVPLDRATFQFGDLDSVLEWVDFFSPDDALYTIAEFQRRTGLDFSAEYRKDFGREYQPPNDDVPMVQPYVEPSPAFKQEILFYWGELQYNPKQRKFMAYTTPEDVDEWNRRYAPNAYALSQMDRSEEDCEISRDSESFEDTVDVATAPPADEPQCHQMVSITSTIAKLDAGTVVTTASRTVIDTLEQAAGSPIFTQISDEIVAPLSPGAKIIAETYRRDLPTSPRRTRSSSKLNEVLRIRVPKSAPDLIDITDMDQSGRCRIARDKEFVCLDYHGRLYAIKAPDKSAALRRLTSFAS